MKRIALSLILFLASAPAPAQRYAVADIRATGSSRYSEQEIIRASGLEESKRKVSLAQVKEAAARLLASGAFQEVGYKHVAAASGIQIELAVKDTRQFVPANFDNIVWLAPAELQRELNARVPLFQGALPINVSGSLPDDVASALQGLLRDRGVSGTVSVAPSGSRQGITDSYVYTVEGTDVLMGQFNFAGTSPTFSPLLEEAVRPLLGMHFQRSNLKKFVESSLVNVYRRRGYLRARFGEPEVTVATHTETVTSVAVTLPVQEGRAYTFGGILFSGNAIRPTEELNRGLHLRGTVNGVLLDADIHAIRTQYAQLGYMHMDLELKPTYDDTAGLVRYEAVVHEGELFRMGKLDIAGLQPSSEEKVRQRWRMREGEPYDDGYVRKFFSQFRLPPGVAYVVEQSEGESRNSIDLTLIFCRQETRCMASGPNQLYIPDEEEPRR